MIFLPPGGDGNSLDGCPRKPLPLTTLRPYFSSAVKMQDLDHVNRRTVFSETGCLKQLELVERFRIRLIGLYHAKVGPSWSSGGREQSDFVHHIDLVCTGRRQVIHQEQVT